jgi:hypothetical protein
MIDREWLTPKDEYNDMVWVVISGILVKLFSFGGYGK